MNLEQQSLSLLSEALTRLEQGFQDLPPISMNIDRDAIRSVLLETAERMQENYPYHHPLYAGQMLKPPHPIARLAYMLALWINPNNHALDGGRASSAMEKEAVANLAKIFGWETHLGHLCGGGTMANMEALWISGKCRPGKTLVASEQAHYTHNRLSEVLGIPFRAIPCDQRAKMDINALEDSLKQGDVGTVVATLGTTASGSIDPLPDILELRNSYDFRLHVDTAYGGYFILADNLAPEARAAFNSISEADSIVVDPHKHGLQPYGCGCVLFKDPSVGRFYKHDSPYTYFSSSELHLGEISLECSRAGAAAAALWATQRLLPMEKGGTFAQGLESSRNAALTLFKYLQEDSRFLTAFPPELDIIIWAPQGKTAKKISRASRHFFEAAAQQNLHLAVASFPRSMLESHWEIAWDQKQIDLLRSCLIKAEHLEWIETIRQTLSSIADTGA
ncbi:aspartate aminotransferase family protein [candidate division KSB3 bacterium]|nr:MAG: aspartate aminotransferase family protein [candidate division KSB3 bacterium]